MPRLLIRSTLLPRMPSSSSCISTWSNNVHWASAANVTSTSTSLSGPKIVAQDRTEDGELHHLPPRTELSHLFVIDVELKVHWRLSSHPALILPGRRGTGQANSKHQAAEPAFTASLFPDLHVCDLELRAWRAVGVQSKHLNSAPPMRVGTEIDRVGVELIVPDRADLDACLFRHPGC
jgi:hypothetical protein